MNGSNMCLNQSADIRSGEVAFIDDSQIQFAVRALTNSRRLWER